MLTQKHGGYVCLISVFCCFLSALVFAEPMAGNIFREYRKVTGALRIGERWEWGGSNSGKNFDLAPTKTSAPYDVDLQDAVKAEAQVFKALVHDKTVGLAISFNDNPYHVFPKAAQIPEPQELYQHRTFPTVEIPLSELKTGKNVFRMRVKADPKPEGQGGWMQNIIYGVYLRVYYKSSKPHPTGRITAPTAGSVVGAMPRIKAEAASSNSSISQVQFLGFHEDFPYQGDGVYRRWHYAYSANSAELEYHIGSVATAPYEKVWDNSWVPDQSQSMKLAARIVDANGMIYMTQAVENVQLTRPGYSIEMCKPYNVPQTWVTRKGTKTENFDVAGDLKQAKTAQTVCVVWKYESNCTYSINGTSLGELKTNNNKVTRNSFDPRVLRIGKNSLTTPKFGHHGIEFNWPGIVVFIQYGATQQLADSGYFTSADSIKVYTGTQFGVRLKYETLGSGKAVLNYPQRPTWVLTAGDSIFGIAPTVTGTETVQAVLKVGSTVCDTLTLRIIVGSSAILPGLDQRHRVQFGECLVLVPAKGKIAFEILAPDPSPYWLVVMTLLAKDSGSRACKAEWATPEKHTRFGIPGPCKTACMLLLFCTTVHTSSKGLYGLDRENVAKSLFPNKPASTFYSDMLKGLGNVEYFCPSSNYTGKPWPLAAGVYP